MHIRALLTALLLSSSLPAQAESEQGLLFKGGAKALLAYKTDFAVQVVDRVTDGCLSNPQSLQSIVENKLSAAGFQVTSNSPEPLGDKVVISVLGHKVSGSACVLHIEAWLNHWLVANVPYAKAVAGGNQTYLSTRHPLGQQLYYTPKTSSLERTQHAVESLTNRLVQDLRESRELADTLFPEIGQEYLRLHTGNQTAEQQP